MVKLFFIFLLTISFAIADTDTADLRDISLLKKVQTFVNPVVYKNNKGYIKIIFSPVSDFYEKDKIDVVKVVSTLKENGLLKLFFKKPKSLDLDFITSGSPIFFVKIMMDSLRNIGYYRYVTVASTLNNSEFTWDINLVSEYATDPLVLDKELKKSGCDISDIKRLSPTQWTYVINMSHAFLNVEKLQNAQKIKLRRSLYPHWLNISKIKSLSIISSQRNRWYPYIVYYDNSLHPLKIIKKNVKTKYIKMNMPKNAVYVKISDTYSLKNVRDSLSLTPNGFR